MLTGWVDGSTVCVLCFGILVIYTSCCSPCGTGRCVWALGFAAYGFCTGNPTVACRSSIRTVPLVFLFLRFSCLCPLCFLFFSPSPLEVHVAVAWRPILNTVQLTLLLHYDKYGDVAPRSYYTLYTVQYVKDTQCVAPCAFLLFIPNLPQQCICCVLYTIYVCQRYAVCSVSVK